MTNVYVWITGADGVGHASMKIGEHIYVSYWPGARADAKKDFQLGQTHKAGWISHLSRDIGLEDRNPDGCIEIEGLHEAAMKTAFEDLKARAPLYNMRKHNCSTVIA